MIRSPLACLVIPLICIGTCPSSGQEFKVVVPNQLETTEGDGGSDPTGSYPNGFRIQTVMLASQFLSLPETHRQITGMRLRPDGSLTSPSTSTWDSFELRLSTTDVALNQSSLVFAENIGPDETIVYDGPITWSTNNTGPAGGPKDFDYVIEFQSPFVYEPSQGNLLLDIFAGGFIGDGEPFDFEVSNPVTSTVTASNVNALVATSRNNSANAFQFIFVPEPSSAVICLTGLVGLLGLQRRCRSGRS